MPIILILCFKVFKGVHFFLFPPMLLRYMCGYVCLVFLCTHVSGKIDASFHEVGFTQMFGKSLLFLDLDFPNLVKNVVSKYLGFQTVTLWILLYVMSECARSSSSGNSTFLNVTSHLPQFPVSLAQCSPLCSLHEPKESFYSVVSL